MPLSLPPACRAGLADGMATLLAPAGWGGSGPTRRSLFSSNLGIYIGMTLLGGRGGGVFYFHNRAFCGCAACWLPAVVPDACVSKRSVYLKKRSCGETTRGGVLWHLSKLLHDFIILFCICFTSTYSVSWHMAGETPLYQ